MAASSRQQLHTTADLQYVLIISGLCVQSVSAEQGAVLTKQLMANAYACCTDTEAIM